MSFSQNNHCSIIWVCKDKSKSVQNFMTNHQQSHTENTRGTFEYGPPFPQPHCATHLPWIMLWHFNHLHEHKSHMLQRCAFSNHKHFSSQNVYQMLLTTGCFVSGSNSVELASVQRHKINKTPDQRINKTGLKHLSYNLPFQPSTLRANSHTASCMPRHTPAVPILNILSYTEAQQ